MKQDTQIPAYPTEATYGLYVPKDHSRLVPGTALVGRDVEDGHIVIYFEEPGDFANVVTFEDRIRQAAGRLHEGYPTSKLMGFTPDSVTRVGTVGYRGKMNWVITELADLETLIAWDEGPHHIGGSPARRLDREGMLISKIMGW